MRSRLCFIFLLAAIFTFVTKALGANIDVRVSGASRLNFIGTDTPSVELTPDMANVVNLGSPAILTSDNKLPVILVPVKAGKATVVVDSPKVTDIIKKEKEEQADLDLSQIMSEVFNIQYLIKTRQLATASASLSLLQHRYPRIVYFDFIRASILFLQNNRSEALALTERALKTHPDNKEGQAFLKGLKGGE